MSAVAAATKFIKSLGVPAGFHAVRVKTTEFDDAGNPKPHIAISIRPGHEGKFNLPAEFGGYPVRLYPWPRDQA